MVIGFTVWATPRLAPHTPDTADTNQELVISCEVCLKEASRKRADKSSSKVHQAWQTREEDPSDPTKRESLWFHTLILFNCEDTHGRNGARLKNSCQCVFILVLASDFDKKMDRQTSRSPRLAWKRLTLTSRLDVVLSIKCTQSVGPLDRILERNYLSRYIHESLLINIPIICQCFTVRRPCC